MKIDLSAKEKQELELEHKRERDGRIKDRIKAILLFSEGWSQVQIATALRIKPKTVHEHLEDYRDSKKLKPANGGSESRLTLAQTMELMNHLEATTYPKAEDI